ncbi:MAG: hypothetical protein OEM41_03410, partial [Ignavibacteria bacterium]|nr:hypothetical protein [Ignavibacteria bacterium]
LPVHDELDDDPNSLNGRRVIADITPDPMLLLRGEVFRDGKISTVTSAPLDIPIGEPLTLGPVEFFLQLQDSSLSDGQRQYRFALRLREGEVQQVVATYDGYLGHSQTIVPAAEHFPLLLWAGDLDGDHRIDFVLDTSNHYNVDEVTLFLSSQAPKGSLVKAVAVSRRVGC